MKQKIDATERKIEIVVIETAENQETATINTIDSILERWEDNFILTVYSENQKPLNNHLKKVLPSIDCDEENIRLYHYEKKYYKLGEIRNFAIQECSSQYLTFLNPGDTVQELNVEEEIFDKNLEILIGNIRGEYKTKETSITSLCFNLETLPRSVQGIIFSSEFLKKNDVKFLDNTDCDSSIICSFYDKLYKTLKEEYYEEGWGIYNLPSFMVNSGKIMKNIEEEIEMIEQYVKSWENNDLHYPKMREVLWNSISREAIELITYDPEEFLEDYGKYLVRENMLNVLSDHD